MNRRFGAGRRGWRLRDRRIRGKLAVILAVPLAAVLLLTGVIGVGAAGQAGQAEQARRLVGLGGAAGVLAEALQQERAAASLVFARGAGPAATQAYRERATATDTAVARFAAARRGVALPTGLDTVVRRVADQVAGLAVLRQQVASAPDVAASLVVFRYRALVADLLAYRQGLSQVGVDAAIANDLRAAAALSQGIESLGLMQVAAARAIDAGRLTPSAQQEVVAADAGFAEAMQTFAGLAPTAWQTRLNARVGGEAVVRAERLQGVVVRTAPDTALNLGVDPAGWTDALAVRMSLMHDVERTIDAALLNQVTEQRDQQRRWLAGLGGLVAAGLIVMVVIGWWVARSLTGSLTRLRTGAETVAGHRLPRMVAELETGPTDPDAVQELMAAAAEPIPVDSGDEVGQVAAAFNSVSAAAVRIAGEQAALRASVAQIFEALARRLQQRSDRTMAGLDVLEQHEEDPDRLAKLFALDHEATLLRRLIVGLQVLAGGRAGRPATEPVSLPDLLRAAASEIDDYKRVDLGAVDADVLIAPDAAPGLIHLLAELLDNAARFSAPDTPVVIDGRRVGDRLHLQVTDRGLGIRDDDLDEIHRRLADPSRLDHRTTQQMGLPVVGRIAGHLGIGVEFRSRWQAGTRVDITVPAGLYTIAPAGPALPAPRQPAPAGRPVAAPAGAASGATVPLPTITPSAAPPPWPLPAPSEPSPPLVIFEQVRSAWFTDLGPAGKPTPAAVPAQWQAAAAAAEAAQHTPAYTTANGLPMRQAGQRLIPQVTAVTTAPRQRNPDEVRRRVSAFQSGLAHAGRRTQRQPLKEAFR